jgi:hypothetical protein
VHSEAVEGLFEESVLAEGRLSLKTRAAVGAGEQARWQGERVCQGEGGVVGSVGQELLPEDLLELPKVGCLPGEGGAMHPPQVREEVGIVAPEVCKELCISSSIPRNSPTTSMVMTSESHSVGVGPRPRRRPRSLMRSSS